MLVRSIKAFLALAAVLAMPVLAKPSPVAPEADAAMRAAVLAADSALFDLFFNGCDAGKMRTLVTENVEFFHDRAGVIARNADAMVGDYEKSCTEKLKPDAWRSRRALDVASARVYPVPGFGAIEEGDHRFFERKGDGPEKLVGVARFVILWQQVGDRWLGARFLSYAHRAATTEEARKAARPQR
jgi:hypothetical protein